MTNLLSLPDEVLVKICRHAIPQTTSAAYKSRTEHPDRNATALSLSLVCRRVGNVAQPLLYLDLALDTEAHSELLASSAAYGRYRTEALALVGKPPRMLGANGSPPRGVANGTAEHLIHISGQVGLRRLSLRGFSRPLGANILEKAGPDLKTLIIHNFSLTEAPSDGLSLPFQLDHLALFGGPFPTFFLSSIISSSLPTITSLTLVTFALPAIQSPLLRLPHLQSLASQLTSLSLHFQLRDPALRDTIASSIGPRLSAFTSIYDLTLNPIEFEPMMDLLRFLPSNPPTLEHLALGVEADQAYPGHSWSHPERQKNWEGLMGSKVMKALETVSWLSNGRQGDRHPAQSPEMMKLLKAGRELRMEWL